MKQYLIAVAKFISVSFVLTLGELMLRPRLQMLIQGSDQRYGYYEAVLVSGAPNIVWYLAIGFCANVAYSIGIMWNAAIIVILISLIGVIQYPSGMWVASDLYAYAVAFAPIVAMPIGYISGFLIARRYCMPKHRNGGSSRAVRS